MKVLTLIVALLLVAGIAVAQVVYMPAHGLSIPVSGAVYRLSGNASSIRIKAATTGLSWRGYREARASNGSLIGYIPSCPPDTTSGKYANFDNHMLPAAADTTIPLDAESVQAWNVYNNVDVDIIVFHNSTAGAIVADVEAVQ